MLNENSPIKMNPIDDDETHCDIPSSLSILEHADILDVRPEDVGSKAMR